MSILKAIIFTILLIVIEVVLSLGFLSLDEFLNLNINEIIHYTQIVNIGTKLLAYLVMFILIFKLRFNKKICFDSVRNIEVKTILFVFVTILGYSLLIKPFSDIKLIIASINDNYVEPVNYINEKYKYLLGYKFVSAIILAPVIEELFFRKIIFKELHRKYSLRISVIVSSLCFSLIHLDYWPNAISSFIFGIISCLIYVKTQNILYPILFHFASNLISVTLIIYLQELFTVQQQLNYNWIYWTSFMLGIGVTIFGLRRITTANNAL